MTDQNQIRTTEEIEQLKKNWMADPCWDIEDTEGFEAHNNELFAWRKEYEAKIEKEWQEREESRAAIVREQTGVVDADIVSSLFTWNEIERELYKAEEDAQTKIAAAQVRATLLQAAQLKRIADAIERFIDGDIKVQIKDPIAQTMIDLMKGTK